jgi:hypothetical protein
MDPLNVILWIGVAVFAATSIIAVLFLAGFIKGPYGKLLVGTLITQIVIACTAAIGSQLKKMDGQNPLPVSNLMITENGYRQVVYDGTTAIYLSSPDVAIDRRVLTLKLDLHEDFSSAKTFEIKHAVETPVEVGNKKYSVFFAKMGKVFDPSDQYKRDDDFVFLSMKRSE